MEKIREYNAAHPENNYYWYDDYLKEKKGEKAEQKDQDEIKSAKSEKKDKG